ncbi:hypothetical protein V6Z12_A05G173500 [Gossypium hirsutum]
MTNISTVSYQAQVNGDKAREVSDKGIIFILAQNSLPLPLLKTEATEIPGMKISRNTRVISHFVFAADDVYILFRSNVILDTWHKSFQVATQSPKNNDLKKNGTRSIRPSRKVIWSVLV